MYSEFSEVLRMNGHFTELKKHQKSEIHWDLQFIYSGLIEV